MYRQAATRLRFAVAGCPSTSVTRWFSTGILEKTQVDEAFVEAWKKVAPNLDPPKTPLSYMKPRPPTPSTIPGKLTVNFVLPYQSELANKEKCLIDHPNSKMINVFNVGPGYDFTITESTRSSGCKFILYHKDLLPPKNMVDMVIVPATSGQMGVLPGHVATIAELKPGVMSVHEGNDVTKYFVSSGFAFIHANSVTDIVAVEAVPLDRIDPDQVQKGLAEFTQKLNSASTDLEKAEAQIGVDVHSVLNAALTG